MSTATKYQLYTFEEFCNLIPEGQKADLIDGVIYMASPDNIEHYNINFWLARLIQEYLETREIVGAVFGFKIAFRLSDIGGPEPDLAFVRGDRLHLVRKTYIAGSPDLAIEIISPDSIERDYKKRKQYDEAGVGEYWIIDPMKQKMTCYARSRNGKLTLIRAIGGKVRSRAIAGFWVKPAWFWQSPLPNVKETLAEILNGAK